jgi:hypothetical protein
MDSSSAGWLNISDGLFAKKSYEGFFKMEKP